MAILTAGIFTACSDQLPLEDNIQYPAEEAGTLIIAPSITLPEGEGNDLLTSRATYYDGNTQRVFFKWSNGDKVGIIPCTENPEQVQFNCNDQTITQADGIYKAIFNPDNLDFAWSTDFNYRAYYPFFKPTDGLADVKSIPLDYDGQIQEGKPDVDNYVNGDKSNYNKTEITSSAHLTAKSFQVSDISKPSSENGSIYFQLSHIGGVVRFYLTLPTDIDANITEVRLVATKPVFHEKAVLNVLDGTTTVTDEATNNLCLELDNVHVKYEAGKYDHILAAYMMAYPVALTNDNILGANGKLYIYVKGKDGGNNDLYFRSGAIKKKDIVAGQLTQFSVSPTDKGDPIDLQPITVQQWEDGLNLDNDGKGTGDW